MKNHLKIVTIIVCCGFLVMSGGIQSAFAGSLHKDWKKAKKKSKKEFKTTYAAFKVAAKKDKDLKKRKSKSLGLIPKLSKKYGDQYDHMLTDALFKHGLGKKLDDLEDAIKGAKKKKAKNKAIDKEKEKILDQAKDVVDIAMKYTGKIGYYRMEWKKYDNTFATTLGKTLNDIIGDVGKLTTKTGVNKHFQ